MSEAATICIWQIKIFETEDNNDRIIGLAREAFSHALSIWADPILPLQDTMLLKFTVKLLTKLRGATPM